MKQSGTTTVFVIICIAVLLGAWGTGLCIRQVRFRNAGIESKAVTEVDKPGIEPEREPAEMAQFRPERRPMTDPGAGRPERRPPREGGAGFGGEGMMGMMEGFQNMSEEERQEAIAQMRERFGSRRQEGRPQLSEEDRAKMREEMEKLMARSEEMSEEERREAMAQIREKYGLTPRGLGGRPGGDRGSGGREGGRRRPGGRRQ